MALRLQREQVLAFKGSANFNIYQNQIVKLGKNQSKRFVPKIGTIHNQVLMAHLC